MRLIGVNSPEAETIAVSSRRQRGHTKQTSCGDADQLERLTLAAIGHASQCEHDTRNRPGSSIPIPSDSASCLPCSNDIPSKSFRCPGTVSRRRSIASGTASGCAAQCAPLSVQDVVQVTVLPWSHALQALTHWFMSRGL